MQDLNIDICANSPQAKGQVERSTLTLQDRLVKELRPRGISDTRTGPARVSARAACCGGDNTTIEREVL